ncbi:hypothetical protein J3R82DRAFT_9697 [Butyriboletus roseoflavus]|nr:hypothetical protein J3R82DRAFT_9697 [Butyriboletus roseoflavus]
MPAMAPSGVPNRRLSIEPQRALLTPSDSSSVGPPDRPPAKRPRLRSTPSSSISTTPSMSNESTSSADFNSARRASTLRVLNTWAQLAERYNKRLDEDDIVDLYSGAIIKDRGVLKGAPRDYHIGHFAQPDDYPDADQDQEDSEQDDDDSEFNALPPSETTTDDDVPISKKELLRGVPPLSATTDAEDLKEFLEAEKRRRVLAGDEDDDEDVSPEQLSAIRKALDEDSRKTEAALADQAQDAATAEHPREVEVDITPTRPSTRVPPSDDESEDELALWTHDESTAIYPVARDESEQDVREVEQEVIELTESDSDEEFEAILTRPPRYIRASPPPVPHLKQVRQPLQSLPDSERGKSKSRTRFHSKTKLAEVTLKSESRHRSPFVPRKPEVVITHKRKPSVSKETSITTPDDGVLDQEVVGSISPVHKGKGKEIPPLVEEGHREKALPKSLGLASLGRKRKRITSSSASGGLLTQSPAEPKSSLRSHGKSTSQSSTTLMQPDGPRPTLDEDVSTPSRFECAVAGPSRPLSSFPSASKTKQPTLSVPAYRSLEPESVQPVSHDDNFNRPLLSDPPFPITHPYSQRHFSHPPSIFSSPTQGTPGVSLPAHPPPPMDPVQTQQAHYLLAQAMHQLSYLISATMPPYAAYAPNPGQSWYPPHPPPHAAYSTPVHQPPHFHGTRPYHTPSSSIYSGLPPSSPVQSSVSPPVEERARSRGRSRSRGRRVSFKLDSGEINGSRERNVQPELHHSGQKIRKPPLEVKREKGKGMATEEFDNSLRIEDRSSPPREVARGRTPGPPSCKKIDVSRGRSLSRR